MVLGMRFCQRHVRFRTLDEIFQAVPPKCLTLANVLLGRVVLPPLPISWQIIPFRRIPGQPVLNASVVSWCHRAWLVEAATVASTSSAAGPARKVCRVPQSGQNERKRPAHGSSLACPVVNLKRLRLNDAHVTKGAPLLRGQSKQWQCVKNYPVASYRIERHKQPPAIMFESMFFPPITFSSLVQKRYSLSLLKRLMRGVKHD